jgi:hypothetical protein
MEDLKLPVFKRTLRARKPLSMDDYYKFVLFNLKCGLINKPNKKLRKAQMPNVPFMIK